MCEIQQLCAALGNVRFSYKEHEYVCVDGNGQAVARINIPYGTILAEIQGEKRYLHEVDPDNTKLFMIDDDYVIDASFSDCPCSCIRYRTDNTCPSNTTIHTEYICSTGEIIALFMTTSLIPRGSAIVLV